MTDRKTLIQESFLGILADRFQNDPLATTYMQTNISTPQDLDVFATQNNISINYQAPNMELVTESFVIAIEKKIKRIYG